MTEKTIRKPTVTKKRIIIALPLLAVIIVSIFALAWLMDTRKPMPEALAALESSDSVTVEVGKWIVFTPEENANSTGFIFYPGAKIKPAAYAPLAKSIAEEGYLVIIVPMLLDLAILSTSAAAGVINEYQSIETWVISGHSLGGVAAAMYAKDNQESITGLVLIGSFPAGSTNLSEASTRVQSIYGSLDGLSTVEEIEKSKALLPPSTEYVEIAGGNHAQFGYYGDQEGDNQATISREVQHQLTVAAIVDFVSGLS